MRSAQKPGIGLRQWVRLEQGATRELLREGAECGLPPSQHMWRSALEPDESTLRDWIHELSERALRHVASYDVRPAQGGLGPQSRKLADQLSESIPEQPHPKGLAHLLSTVERAADAGLLAPGPGYMAYVPGGGLLSSGLADWFAAWLNRYTGLAAASPALVRLEADVLRFLASEFGFGPGARGVFTTGGSLANLSALVCARTHVLGESGDYRRALLYVSEQVHHSVAKAVRVAGIPVGNVIPLATDAQMRLCPSALAARVAADKAEGAKPFFVVSSAGTVNTGAIDPFRDVSAIANEYGLWHHVDGAYGGAFVLCPEGRQRLAGIEHADSVTFDPHKAMFLPYGTGCLLVRQGERLMRTYQMSAEYLGDLDTVPAADAIPSPADHSPELSREYRGLRVWLSLMLFGAKAFRDALSEKLELAQYFNDRLREGIADGLPVQIVQPPQLSTVSFRLERAAGEPLAEYNARNATWLARLNQAGRAFLSSTKLESDEGEVLTLRVCILNFRTHRERIDACLEDLKKALPGLT